jgi:hypothetical protein
LFLMTVDCLCSLMRTCSFPSFAVYSMAMFMVYRLLQYLGGAHSMHAATYWELCTLIACCHLDAAACGNTGLDLSIHTHSYVMSAEAACTAVYTSTHAVTSSSQSTGLWSLHLLCACICMNGLCLQLLTCCVFFLWGVAVV